MHSTAALLAVGFVAAAVSADVNIFPGHLAAKRELAARQTSPTGDSEACLTALVSIYSSLPTPAPELLSFQQTDTQTNPCSYTVPASLSDQWRSYESTVTSWASANSAKISSALSQCPQYSSLADSAGVCTAGGVAGTSSSSSSLSTAAASDATDATTTAATASTTTKATGSGSESASVSGSSASGQSAATSITSTRNAGPRETSFVAGVVAAAGFLGVVAAL